MASLHDLTSPIPHDLKGLQALLIKLQGNILKGHGRDHSVHIFLKFTANKLIVKQRISELAKEITSAQQQLDEARRYRDYKIPGPTFMSFFLSASGYRYLGFDVAKNPGFDQQAFLHGMKAARHRLNDPHEDDWDKEYRQEIDAMVLLADNAEHFLLREAHRRLNDVSAYARICAVEHGRVMRNAQGGSIEHFGYADGYSQPLFFQEDIDRGRQNGNRTNIWGSGDGPDIVLVSDPYGEEKDAASNTLHHYSGSYLVFRKLEQNVRKYKESEKELANALGLTGEDAKRAGALVMGRFEDGTPVVLQPTAGRPTNNFTYIDDPNGEKCPLQAHIRKVNPRQEGMPRIVRRGITYGKRWKEPTDNPSLEELPSKDVGLVFMCYQRNIEKQFEFLQLAWANNPHFPLKQAPGIDPVIGQASGSGTGQQKWPARWNDLSENHKPFDFHGCVTLKGGEYFFALSIYFLENIVNV
jgi:Dyp-type peroxidase family